MPSTVREIALRIIIKCEKDSAYSNLELNNELKKNSFSDVDRAFLTQLVNGTLEKFVIIDYYIKVYSKIKISKMSSIIKNILRLGIYQILFLDRVPDSAVCNESVIITKKFIGNNLSGFVNGVLRTISREKEKDILPIRETDEIKYLSLKYSVPLWIVNLFINAYGEIICEKIISTNQISNQSSIRINTNKTDFISLKCLLNEEEIEINKNSLLENSASIKFNCNIENLNAYKLGLFHIQNCSCQLCCFVLNPKENESILDICSAPGGKTFTISQLMKNTGNICALDLHKHRVKLVKNGAFRLGLSNITAKEMDASKPMGFPKNLFDKILCDVPCSGLGVINNKPDIMLKQENSIDELPSLQRKLLENASIHLKIGGTLVYSTCTLNPKENEDIINSFIKENGNFVFNDISEFIPKKINAIKDFGYFTILPSEEWDGFFISSIKKIM